MQQLRRARAARRGRDFGTVHLALDAAVRAFPRYTAALLERGISYLDERRNAEALAAFERTLAVDGTAPAIDEWIIRAAAAQRRAAPPATSASAAADELAARQRRLAAMPLPDGCEKLVFGKSQGAHRKVATLSDASRVCPTLLNRTNWLSGDSYTDAFELRRNEVPNPAVVVAVRIDRPDGWGLDLAAACCEPGRSLTPPYDLITPDEADERAAKAAEAKGAEETPEERAAREAAEAAAAAEAARFRSACHYEVLGVPVDFTAAELKVYRALSLRLHPDRGGSAEAFARAATAHDCLSDEACRKTFHEGGEVVEAADRHGRVVSFAEKTERKYFPERFPFEPFGSAFEDHPEREERRKRRRPTSPPPAAPCRLHQEDVHPHSAPHSEAKQEL